MTFGRALINVLLSAVTMSAFGGAIGFFLGKFAPEYYRSAFRSGGDTSFDPVNTGVGLGVTQGAAAGILAGLVVVALLCWRDVRLSRKLNHSGEIQSHRGGKSSQVLRYAGIFLMLILAASAAFVVGAIAGERGAYHRRFIEERDLVATELTNDAAFAKVEIKERSRGGIFLTGEVGSAEELERLRDLIVRVLGQNRATEIIYPVSAREAKSGQ